MKKLLVVELWGLGDVALAAPFLRAASERFDVTLVSKPHAAPILGRFAPSVRHVSFAAPWTAFSHKYRLLTWPWPALRKLLAELRTRQFEIGVSARRDPRDHLLLALSRARRRVGFPRLGSHVFLTESLQVSNRTHRSDCWSAIARRLDLSLPPPPVAPRGGRSIVMHVGAGHAVRAWPRERFDAVAELLRRAGWDVAIVDNSLTDLDQLMTILNRADRFIGNDSGPGHLAALLGVPTFTVFGPQLPALFAPQHPQAAWIEGAPCRHKPCFDACRFAAPHCLLEVTVSGLWTRLEPWLREPTPPRR